MREIKFRAWDKVEKKMLFDADPFALHVSGSNEPLLAKTHRNEDCIFEEYTGLKDKNGKEIYEGDIVKIARSYGYGFLTKGAKARIEFDEKELCYKLRGNGEFRLTAKKELEVIGNIHENPELLEAKNVY